jgi:hypothetical protein
VETSPENELMPTTNEVASTKKRILLFFISYIIAVIIITGIIVAKIVVDQLRYVQLGFMDQPIFTETLLRRAFGIFYTTLFVLPVGFVLALEWVLQDVFGLDIILVSGLHIPSPANPMDTPLQAVSQGLTYLLFLSITIRGILTKSRRTFRILYYIFVGLLITAIGGCMRIN